VLLGGAGLAQAGARAADEPQLRGLTIEGLPRIPGPGA
jgi:hypothetical protein